MSEGPRPEGHFSPDGNILFHYCPVRSRRLRWRGDNFVVSRLGRKDGKIHAGLYGDEYNIYIRRTGLKVSCQI